MSEEFPIAKFFYNTLLGLYPKPHQKEYADEMKMVFEDLYQEEKSKNQDISLIFWVYLIGDVLTSTLAQHKELLYKIGFKKYLETAFSPQTLIFISSLILLFPFVTLIGLDTSTVLLTGNREAMSGIYDSPFWNIPIILTVVLVLPLITVLMNLFIIIQYAEKKRYQILTVSFLGHNFLNLSVLSVGLFAILMLFGHDFVPCLVNHIFKDGLLNFGSEFVYCGKYS